MARTDFRNPRWMTVLAASAAVASWVAAWALHGSEATWIVIFFIGLGLAAALAAYEAGVARLELGGEGLTLKTGFRERSIAKGEIESVSWAGGCPVTLHLVGGELVRLPSFGESSPGLSNSIRAWHGRATASREA